MNYTQCVLKRQNSVSSVTTLVSWIPSKFAKLGGFVCLKDEEGTWVVTKLGNTREEKHLMDSHDSIKGLWRETSGENPIGHK